MDNDMQEQENLKPCPFCGGESTSVLPYGSLGTCYAMCNNSECLMHGMYVQITTWQTRAYESEIESLKHQLGLLTVDDVFDAVTIEAKIKAEGIREAACYVDDCSAKVLNDLADGIEKGK